MRRMLTAGGKAGQIALILIAVLALLAAFTIAGSVVAPIAFALFIIALVWPTQVFLQRHVPRFLAQLISFILVVIAFLAFGWLIVWAFGQVGRWVVADAARFQMLYEQFREWLEGHGIAVAVLWSDNFGVSWILRTVQSVSSRLNNMFSFWMIALIYVLLGLIEVEDFGRRIRKLRNGTAIRILLDGTRETADKLRRYMMIRTVMSVATGVLVWIFARAIGLPLAEEWGFIAFALNYIPFIGPFVATLFPTMFALMQFETWQGVLAFFIGLNIIQTVGGSYIEPRVSGGMLSMSPIVVLFSVFLWGYLWGVFGAFIGVPITIAILTYCSQHTSTEWISKLFGAEVGKESVGEGTV